MVDVLIGTTDYTRTVFIPDPASTDGSGKTGLTAADLTVSYTRVETDNDVTVTDVTSSLSTLSALTDAHTDWGIKEVSSTLAPGLYRIDIADAVFAAGAWSAVVYVMITSSAAAASPIGFELVALNKLDGVRGGMTALPNAAAEAAGGLYTRGSGAGQINQPSNGMVDANVVRNAGTAITAAAGIQEVKVASIAANAIDAASIASSAFAAAKFAAGAFDAVWSVTTRLLTAGTNIVLAKGTGVTGFNDLSAAQVNAEADTAIADVGLTTTVTGRIDASVSSRLASAGYTAPASAGSIADAVWDEGLAGHTGVAGSTAEALNAAGSAGDPWTTALPGSYGSGQAGFLIGTYIDAAISSRLASGSYSAPPSAATIRSEIDGNSTQLAGIVGAIADVPTNAELAIALASADDAILAAIAALNNLSAAQVNAEVVDALATDTYGDPAGVPPTTASLAAKINQIYAALRNGLEITAAAKTFKNASGTAQWKKTLADDGSAYSEGAAAAP